jgi:GR25 family glycosyltransferase involved in LPS biosynthesis
MNNKLDIKFIVNIILGICLLFVIYVYFNINNEYLTNISYTKIKNNYVINLDRRKDRWDDFLLKIDKTSFSKEPIERFSAFDGSKYNDELKRFNMEDHKLIKKLKEIKLIVPKGVFGCMMSHLLILQTIRDDSKYDDNDYIGIFEEDLMFSSNFEENYAKLNKINLDSLGVEFLYLGGRDISDYSLSENDMDLYETTKNPNIYYRKDYNSKKQWAWDRCTFSYIVKKSICNKLINIIIDTFPTPKFGDLFKPVDHIYTDAYSKIKTFDFFPHLFYSIINYNSDIQNTNLNNKLEFFIHTKNNSLYNLIYF